MHEDGEHTSIEARYPILQFFDYKHLPERLADISRSFYELAWEMAEAHPDGSPEIAACLRKLIEAKDCAVRANVFRAQPRG